MSYLTHDIPVRGGALRVGEWTSDASAEAPVILAFHGITASHRCWPLVASKLPGYRFIAPDLRGRGHSNALPAPYGFTQHAEDALAILDALGIEKALLVGHSMGGFVAAVTAARFPERVSGVLLVDGGLPLALPPGIDVETVVTATLGPAAERLSMTFPSRDAYLNFWRQHPSFIGHWSTLVEDYANYDLVGDEPELHPSTSPQAMLADAAQQFAGGPVEAAVERLPKRTRMLTAPRGLLNAAPGLYAPAAVASWHERMPDLTITEVPDINHYTIVMSDRGAEAVASEIRALTG